MVRALLLASAAILSPLFSPVTSPILGDGDAATPPAVNGDPIAVTILDASVVTTSPTNNIDGNGYIAAITFKGMALGQALTPSKISFNYEEPGYDFDGNAIWVPRTATATEAMRLPVAPLWVTSTVVAAGAWCAHKVSSTTRLYSTTAGGTTGATPPTHTSGTVSDGGVLWTFLSECTPTTPNTASQPVEAASGPDAVIYVVLDKLVTSGARFTGATASFQAGAYGSSNAGYSANVVFTNNSTAEPLVPAIAHATPPWQLVRSGETFRAEVSATHPFGQSSRMAACVKFTIYDNSNVATSLVTTSATMEQSEYFTTTYGNPVPVFAAEWTQAAMTTAGLADGTYSYRVEVFPFIGGKWDSDVDGFGSVSSWSISTVMRGNNAARIPFTLDADNSIPIYYACVDGIGAAPAVSTDEATARTTPFANIRLAADGLQTATGSTVAYQIVDILGGTTLTGFGGTLDAKTYGNGWLTIRKYPGDVGLATINADTVTSANRICGKRTKFYDVELNAVGTTPVVQNGELASAGVVAHELWFDNCRLTGTGTQQPLTSSGWLFISNSLLTNISTAMMGNTRNAWYMLGGSTITASGSSNFASSQSVHNLGNKFQARALIGVPISRYWAENSQAVDHQVFGFNTFYTADANVVWAVRCNGSLDGGATSATISNTGPSAYVQNLIEAVNSKGGEISGDGITTPLHMLYNMYNTSAGDGQNVGYNDTGATQFKKRAIDRFNFLQDRNTKGDTFSDASVQVSSVRTGAYFVRFKVESLCNVVIAATQPDPSASNNSGEIVETRSVMTATKGFTDDRSKTGSPTTGGGNYVPTSLSGAKDRIGATEQMLPFDLNGTARKTDGTGAVGAFEWA